MRNIKQLQSIKFDKEGWEFKEELKHVRDVWGLFIHTYTTKEISPSDINFNVFSDLVGTVIHYHDGSFECNLERIDFQAEYTEDELKKLIIDDIMLEEVLQGVYEKSIYESLAKGLQNFNSCIKEGINTIKGHDNDYTNLKVDFQQLEGEDGVEFLRKGESILSPEHTEELKELFSKPLPPLPPLRNDLFSKPNKETNLLLTELERSIKNFSRYIIVYPTYYKFKDEVMKLEDIVKTIRENIENK
jgi:hypothetical protein